MTDTQLNFTAALRVVIADTDEPDMRAVARRALELLDADQVFEAATTHLAGLARRQWNLIATERGTVSPSSEEVVSLRGADTFLGDTTTSDREFMARNRESLARGLNKRARRLREMGRNGPAVSIVPSSREVLDAERRADEISALADALDRVTDGIGGGGSVIEQRAAAAIQRADERRGKSEQKVGRFRAVAERLTTADGVGVPRARRAIQRMAKEMGL